jgi:hypothetical protein
MRVDPLAANSHVGDDRSGGTNAATPSAARPSIAAGSYGGSNEDSHHSAHCRKPGMRLRGGK